MKKYPPLKLKLTVFLTQISLVTVVVLLAAALFFVSIIEKLSAEDELRTALKQIEIKIANATETLLVEEHTLTQMSLTKANALELLLKYNISAATSQEELDKVRAVLQTEEINIIDTSGRIINASPPTSIGSDGKIY
ncbi:MAG: hypothetical protein LBN42_00740, partial [Oscillospiraceae bacterium]|nr:hypothetical protein [Oscillospiraceae bacterium]